MADMVLIQAAVSSVKVAGEIAVGLMKLRTMSEVQAKAIELNQKLIEAQHSIFAAHAAQSALVDRIHELEAELVQVKAWERQKYRYKLVAPWAGSFVYALKASMSEGEPPHWICTQCYEYGKRQILQGIYDHTWGRFHYPCSACSMDVSSPYNAAMTIEYADG